MKLLIIFYLPISYKNAPLRQFLDLYSPQPINIIYCIRCSHDTVQGLALIDTADNVRALLDYCIHGVGIDHLFVGRRESSSICRGCTF